MGDHADDALNEIMDEVDIWEEGAPEEDGYPMFHPMGKGPPQVEQKEQDEIHT